MRHRLDQDAIDLYRHAVLNPTWTPQEAAAAIGLDEGRLRAALSTLCGLMLLQPSPDRHRAFDAVGPESAVAELLANEELELRRRQAEVTAVRGHVLGMVPHYFEARRERRRHEAIDQVDAAAASRLLADWARRIREEVLIAHPGGGWSAERLQHSLQADHMILDRGATLRVLLQHATVRHEPTRAWAAEIVAAGGEVRTVPVVPNRMILHDRERAMLPPEGGDVTNGAIVVREPGVVDFLVAVHQLLWNQGTDYPLTAANGEEVGSESGADAALRRAVLEQLVTGAKDDVIARRLGMSVRSCRRHITDIVRDLGAESRFQAGVLAVRRGMLDQSH